MSPFWILLELRMKEVMVTTGTIRRAIIIAIIIIIIVLNPNPDRDDFRNLTVNSLPRDTSPLRLS